jgi:DNA-binding NarL/FixJ family response regulator
VDRDTDPRALVALGRVGDGELEEFVRRPAAATPTEPPLGFDTLTAREAEVLNAVARGLSNTEIGDTLFMSPATAKTHVSRLLAKLHARDRAQLVMVAYEAGAVAPGVP